MATSYLSLVNQVLTKLRESTVMSVASTPYSALIGSFINDAKAEVEDSWQWLVLQDAISYATTTGVYQYNTDTYLTDRTSAPANERARLWIDSFINTPIHMITTTNFIRNIVYEPTLEDMQGKWNILTQNITDIPSSYQILPCTTINTGQWSKTINLYAIPNAVYNLKLYIVNPQNDLVNDGDLMKVPARAVVYKAYLYALFERGEELGETLDTVQDRVEQLLSDAITMDQQIQAQYMQLAVPYGAQY